MIILDAKMRHRKSGRQGDQLGDYVVVQVMDDGVPQRSLKRKWQPTPGFLPGRSHGQRSLVGYSPWGHRESDLTEHTRYRKELYLVNSDLI